jgi:hypothetical protein
MDAEQDRRFREAVERKREQADAASRATQPGNAEGGDLAGDQENLREPGRPQDTFSPREKNSRHKKVTADKWNQ